MTENSSLGPTMKSLNPNKQINEVIYMQYTAIIIIAVKWLFADEKLCFFRISVQHINPGRSLHVTKRRTK